MLSKEVSTVYVTDPENPEKTRRATGEINWSLGTYIEVPQIEKAFNVTGLPRPSGVAVSPIDGALYIANDKGGTVYRNELSGALHGLLHLLATHPGIVFSREALLDRLQEGACANAS